MPPPRGTSQKNIISFGAGEWSPDLDARADQQKYDSACRELTNMIVLPSGPAERRPGQQFIGIAKGKNRLIGYNFSVTTRFILELGDRYMRFWSNGVQVENPPGTPVEIVTPWLEAELFDIHFVQVNDIVYLTHPNHAPQKLTRITDVNWVIVDTPFNEPPFLDVNITATTLRSTVTALGANGQMIAAGPAIPFQAGHVGSFWKLTHPRSAGGVDISLAATNNSANLLVTGTWTFRTTGTWTGTVRVQEFNPVTGVFDDVRVFESNNDSNFDIEDIQPIEATFRISHTAVSGTGRAYLDVLDTTRSGIVKVTGFNSATSVNINVIKQLESTAITDVWNEGSWSDVRGFPRTNTIFEQRIIYGGTLAQPQTLYGSRTADYEDFTRGTLDDDAIVYTIASLEQNRIEWMSGQIKLLIGTAGAEWTFGGDVEKPVTPSNVTIFRQSTYGSKHLQGVMINDAILFVQRNGLRVRQMVESETSVTAKFVSPDLTILADHITEGEVIQSDYAQQPFSTLWIVNGIGEMIGMTYERDQAISGWHRQTSPGANGFIESMATIYGDTARGDEIWLSVKRTINGADVRYIERWNPFDWKLKEDAFYVDSGVTIVLPTHSSGNLTAGKSYRVIDNSGGMDMTAVGGPAAPKVFETFLATSTATPNYGTGSVRQVSDVFPQAVPHLRGEIVQALGDGAVFENMTVTADGTITLTNNDMVTKVHIGLQYDSVVKPMKLQADPRLGAYMGTVSRIRQIVVRVQDTLGFTYSTNVLEADNVTVKEEVVAFRATKNKFDESPPLRTGDLKVPVQSRHDFDGDLTLFQKQPLPFKVLAIIVKHEVTGN